MKLTLKASRRLVHGPGPEAFSVTSWRRGDPTVLDCICPAGRLRRVAGAVVSCTCDQVHGRAVDMIMDTVHAIMAECQLVRSTQVQSYGPYFASTGTNVETVHQGQTND